MLENFLSILCLTRGKNKKVIEVSEKHFKTKKKYGFFPYLGGRGQPTHGNFMFSHFYFCKLPLITHQVQEMLSHLTNS